MKCLTFIFLLLFQGYTPLHISAQFGHKEVFKLLIEVYKADPNIRDYSGRTADYYLMAKQQKGTTGHHVTLRSEYPSKSRSLRHGKAKSKSFRSKHISAPLAAVSNPTNTT
nr:unnamed protein product [Callosobruchus chinensis]